MVKRPIEREKERERDIQHGFFLRVFPCSCLTGKHCLCGLVCAGEWAERSQRGCLSDSLHMFSCARMLLCARVSNVCSCVVERDYRGVCLLYERERQRKRCRQRASTRQRCVCDCGSTFVCTCWRVFPCSSMIGKHRLRGLVCAGEWAERSQRV